MYAREAFFESILTHIETVGTLTNKGCSQGRLLSESGIYLFFIFFSYWAALHRKFCTYFLFRQDHFWRNANLFNARKAFQGSWFIHLQMYVRPVWLLEIGISHNLADQQEMFRKEEIAPLVFESLSIYKPSPSFAAEKITNE